MNYKNFSLGLLGITLFYFLASYNNDKYDKPSNLLVASFYILGGACFLGAKGE